MDIKSLTCMGDAEDTIRENIRVLVRESLPELRANCEFRDEFNRRFKNDLKLVVIE